MFDSNFVAFAGVAALLVLSPGATWAVVTDGAIDGGTRAGLWTVAGIGAANFLLATASAFGLSALFHRFPVVLHALAVCGALYMAYLGLRALGRAVNGPFDPSTSSGSPRAKSRGDSRASQPLAQGKRSDEGTEGDRAQARRPAMVSPIARFGRGLLTNLSNVSVVLFYTVVVPQFIGPHDNVLGRYLLLCQTHVAMSVAWMGAMALFVGTLAAHLTRPGVRRTMDALTGVALLAFAAKIAVSV